MAEVKKSKVVDKWKTKSWYSVLAPEYFDNKEIGQVLASDEATIKNRIIRTSLGDLTGSFSPGTAYTSVRFRIIEVKGKIANVKFIGHELMPGYIRTLVRRRRSVINEIVEITTKEGDVLRVKLIAISAGKVSESARHALRAALRTEILANTKDIDTRTLIGEVLFGKLASRVVGKLKKIAPVRKIEVRKTELKEKFA